MRTVWLSEQQMSIDTVVFATDFSPASYVASLYATALAEHFHCKLLLMHVFVPSQSAQDAEAQSGLPSEDRKFATATTRSHRGSSKTTKRGGEVTAG